MDKKTAIRIATILSISTLIAIIINYFTKGNIIINAIDRLKRNGKWNKRSIENITDITIHHGASSRTATIYDYNRWHTEEKGWPSIGYHYVIYQDGRIFQTNYIDSLTYHNGYNNSVAIGVCLVGNFENYNVPDIQYKSLLYLVKSLKKRKELKSLNRLIGHKEYVSSTTACPGKYFPISKTRNIVKMKGISNFYEKSLKDTKSLLPIEIYNYNEADN